MHGKHTPPSHLSNFNADLFCVHTATRGVWTGSTFLENLPGPQNWPQELPDDGA